MQFDGLSQVQAQPVDQTWSSSGDSALQAEQGGGEGRAGGCHWRTPAPSLWDLRQPLNRSVTTAVPVSQRLHSRRLLHHLLQRWKVYQHTSIKLTTAAAHYQFQAISLKLFILASYVRCLAEVFSQRQRACVVMVIYKHIANA